MKQLSRRILFSTALMRLCIFCLASKTLAANVNIQTNQKIQTIEGFGVNCNTESWGLYGDLKQALNFLTDTLGASLFRCVIEEMDLEDTNDDCDPTHFNWDYYNTLYSNTKFQKVWATLEYLNSKGIGKNGLIISYMGKAPNWMESSFLVVAQNKEARGETGCQWSWRH